MCLVTDAMHFRRAGWSSSSSSWVGERSREERRRSTNSKVAPATVRLEETATSSWRSDAVSLYQQAGTDSPIALDFARAQ